MNTAYIGLGSNLNHPASQIKNALLALKKISNTTLVRASSLYSTPPLGPADQPDYLNAVVELHTGLSASDLHIKLQEIELAQGRVRDKKIWGLPRTLDLDLLLFGDHTIKTKTLTVPHPGIASRSFVIYPLYEINSELLFPDGTSLHQLYEQCKSAEIKLYRDN